MIYYPKETRARQGNKHQWIWVGKTNESPAVCNVCKLRIKVEARKRVKKSAHNPAATTTLITMYLDGGKWIEVRGVKAKLPSCIDGD